MGSLAEAIAEEGLETRHGRDIVTPANERAGNSEHKRPSKPARQISAPLNRSICTNVSNIHDRSGRDEKHQIW